jgi:3',5'-cyclic AMP phosphodiesterase CpdA
VGGTIVHTPDALAAAAEARVVQLSDTHVAEAEGVPAPLAGLLDWIAADPPDLVILTGDIVYQDPDHDADRAFARAVVGALPCPWVAIPGNHDVGFYDETDHRDRRLAAFVDTWRADRFALDVAGWRLVGANAYTIGDGAADDWLAGACDGAQPVALFIHHPLDAEPVDGWEMPGTVRARVAELLDGAPVRVVASGHRHCAVVRDRPGGPAAGDAVHVWAPSGHLRGNNAYHAGDPSPGAVEHRFAADGGYAHRFVPAPRPP